MSEQATAQNGPLPIVPYLRIPDTGDPHLEGLKCKACGAIYLAGDRPACAKCGAQDSFETIQLSNRGELYVYTIIHRSFPGIDVPYISAIVDLEGGGTVKGNLINVEPDPKCLEFGMPVELIYQIAPRKDAEGNEYLTYYFQPRS